MVSPQQHVRLLLCIAFFLLSACSPGSQTNQPQTVIEVTRIVRETVIVTQVVEKVITATPVAATPTPEPASTPEMTATPVYQIWMSNQVVDEFIAAGLEVGDLRPMTKDDYGLAPYVAVEGTRFLIPSLCPDCGGRIMSFSNPEDLEVTKAYYETLGESSAAFFSWVFMKDNILVQINGELPEEQALAYQDALETLGN